MQTIILATHNPDKARELKSLWVRDDIQIRTLADFPDIGDIPETGSTLLENSFIKARTVQAATGLPAIADDTGLEVDALDGAPGIYAARYAGGNATYADNVNKLLRDLVSVPPDKRTARFRTVMSFVDQSHELWSEGVVEGVILPAPRGSRGFGYDPVFYIPEYDRTFAEMPASLKHSISHRSKAMTGLLAKIQPLFTLSEKEYPIE